MPRSSKAPQTGVEVIDQSEEILSNLEFLKALENMQVLLPGGIVVPLQWQPGSRNIVLDLRNITPSGATPASQLPTQGLQTGAVLTTTDGVTLTWV